MTGMLRDAKLFNQDLNEWDIRKVTNMSEMFYHASNFNIENNITNIPVADILVKGLCFSEHPRHIIYFTGIPFAYVLVKRLVECKHV
jgi:hypothetical protein